MSSSFKDRKRKEKIAKTDAKLPIIGDLAITHHFFTSNVLPNTGVVT